MRLVPTIKVTAHLEVNDSEAEILQHLTDYSLHQWFAEKCNRTIPAERIRDTLERLRSQLRLIIEARDEAIKAVMTRQKKGVSD